MSLFCMLPEISFDLVSVSFGQFASMVVMQVDLHCQFHLTPIIWKLFIIRRANSLVLTDICFFFNAFDLGTT